MPNDVIISQLFWLHSIWPSALGRSFLQTKSIKSTNGVRMFDLSDIFFKCWASFLNRKEKWETIWLNRRLNDNLWWMCLKQVIVNKLYYWWIIQDNNVITQYSQCQHWAVQHSLIPGFLVLISLLTLWHKVQDKIV